MFKIKAVFSKDEDMVYISHLDLMRLFQRALRRAAFAFHLTEGFNPHPKISSFGALAVGKSSFDEKIIFCLDEKIPAAEFVARMNKQLPKGVIIKDAFYQS